MKQKLLFILFALMLPLMAFADKEGKCGDNATYRFSEATGTLTIEGSGPMIDGSWGKGKWVGRPDYDKYVKKITTVVIKEGITTIGVGAFSGFKALTSIIIPNSVTIIKGSAFLGCGLKVVDIPNSVKEIYNGAFSNCNNLKSVTLPAQIIRINSETFLGCDGLTSIHIPSSVRSIDEYAFGECSNLATVYIANKNTEVHKDAFKSPYGFADHASAKIIYGEKDQPHLAQSTPNTSKEEKSEPAAQPQKEITQQMTISNQPKLEPKIQANQEPKTEQKAVQQVAATPAPKQAPQNTIANVDKNIPESGQVDKNTFVVVIGNEKYEDEADVPFAENDARIFTEYCKKTLGISEKHIRSYVNAGYNDIRKAVSWLKQGLSAYEGEGRAIFYYAGHGIPNEADKSAYLLPVDGVGSDIESAYSLNKLYQSLSELPAESVLVFLDACFSGAKREGGMMASARGVAIKTKAEDAKGKMVIFSAAQGDETAYPFKSQQHGMFTYYLLKILSETKGQVTLGELGDYLRREVKRESFDENNKMQTPTVNASSALANSWRSMKLR